MRNANMKRMFLLVFSFPLILSLIPSSSRAEEAQWLVRYNKTDEQFELNKDALSKLSHLPKLVKVISAIGEARLGKSTTLNFIRHILGCDWKNEAEIEEVFKTGNSSEPVTYGIWMSACEKESIVLLDVEGTNLGNDAVTSHMSVFTSLMSSGIVVFSSQTVKNDILNFLYEVTRLSEHIFKDIGTKINNNFGHLNIVIRDPLSPPPGKTFEDEVRDMIVKPSGENIATDKKRRAIAKYFHKNNIKVSKMPLIGNHKLLKDIQIKKHVEFWNTIQSLSQSFKNFPAKTTLRSNLVDGEALVQTARTLIKMMNKNSWLDFGDNYVMVEKSLCDKSFQVTVAPILALETAHELEQKEAFVLKAFKDGCALTEEVNKVEYQLWRLISDKRDKEEKARQLKAAEETKRAAEIVREAAERSRIQMEENAKTAIQQLENEKRKKEQKVRQLNAAEEAKRRGEEARRRAEMERQATELKRLQMEKQAIKAKQREENLKQTKKRKKRKDLGGLLTGAIAGGGLLALFSDERLKANVITVNPSKYEALGVWEVTWTWNKQAEKIGLHGKARGVIAQEVEKLYPWAVVTGSDGYKRVLYGALDYALDLMKKAKRKEDKPD